MQRIDRRQTAVRAMAPVLLLLGIPLNAATAQVMSRRVPPAPTPATTTVAVPAPAAKPSVVAPAGSPKPDLAFSFVSVESRTFPVSGATAPPLVVSNVVPPGNMPCDQPFTFPFQLIVKNIGQADFVPDRNVPYAYVAIGSWGERRDLVRLAPGASQSMKFSVKVVRGKYQMIASLTVDEPRTDNNTVVAPLEVNCEVKAPTLMARASSSGAAAAPPGANAAAQSPGDSCPADGTPAIFRARPAGGTTLAFGANVYANEYLVIDGCNFGTSGTIGLILSANPSKALLMRLGPWDDGRIQAEPIGPGASAPAGERTGPYRIMVAAQRANGGRSAQGLSLMQLYFVNGPRP